MSSLPSLGPRGEGWVVIQLGLLALVAACGWWLGPDWTGALRFTGIVAGIISIAAGTILAGRGLLDLGGALTPNPRPRDDAMLIETGVYGLARHPIYGGLILGSFGWGLIQASVVALGATALLVGFFVLKSTREETWLLERFPGYPAYRARTKRFIPWIG